MISSKEVDEPDFRQANGADSSQAIPPGSFKLRARLSGFFIHSSLRLFDEAHVLNSHTRVCMFASLVSLEVHQFHFRLLATCVIFWMVMMIRFGTHPHTHFLVSISRDPPPRLPYFIPFSNGARIQRKNEREGEREPRRIMRYIPHSCVLSAIHKEIMGRSLPPSSPFISSLKRAATLSSGRHV